MIKCRECEHPAKYALTNIVFSLKPFVCGIHARALPYSTMNKIGIVNKKEEING